MSTEKEAAITGGDTGRGSRRLRQGGVLSLGLALLAGLWLASGMGADAPAPGAGKPKIEPSPEATVAVVLSRAQSRPRVRVFEGETVPDLDVWVRSAVAGRVEEILVTPGAQVAEGDVIARLEASAEQAREARAEAAVLRARRDLERAEVLEARGAASEERVEALSLALVGAEADLAAARADLEARQLRAPGAGRVEELTADVGERIAQGASVARIVALDPLRIHLRIPQRDALDVAPGRAVKVDFGRGRQFPALLGHVSGVPDPASRTYRAEVMLDNPGGQLPAGLGVSVEIVLGEAVVHAVPVTAVSLDPEGRPIVKLARPLQVGGFAGAVGSRDDALAGGSVPAQVEVHAVDILAPQDDAILVSGLADTVGLIVRGQGFVEAGAQVRAVLLDPSEVWPGARLGRAPEAAQALGPGEDLRP